MVIVHYGDAIENRDTREMVRRRARRFLDLFAGTNDYAAAKKGRTAGHKEINRTTLALIDIEMGLARAIVRDQLELIRLRNTSPAFDGEMELRDCEPQQLIITWRHPQEVLTLEADLHDHTYSIYRERNDARELLLSPSSPAAATA